MLRRAICSASAPARSAAGARASAEAAYSRLLRAASAENETDFGSRKRAVLQLARADENALQHVPRAELAALARTPLPTAGRKEVNALKRLRKAHLDAHEEPPKECAATRHEFSAQGEPGLSDALRLVHVHAEERSHTLLAEETAVSIVDASLVALGLE